MSDATELRTEVRRRIDAETLKDLSNQREGGDQAEDDDRLLAACEDAIEAFADHGLEYVSTSKAHIRLGNRLTQYELAVGAWNYEHATQIKTLTDAAFDRLLAQSKELAVTDSRIVIGDRADNDDFDHNPNVYDDLRLGSQNSTPEVNTDPRDN